MKCPNCNSEEYQIIPRPDTPHSGGERRCIQCNSFMGWAPTQTKEGIRTKSTKYDLTPIMRHKKYSGEPFCFFCGRTKNQLGQNETLTIDHIQPIRDEGLDELINLQILCTACHKLRHWAELYTNKHFVGETK